MKKIALVYGIISLVAVADPCLEWFQQSKIQPGPKCTKQCSILSTGMGTYFCPQKCKIFCSQTKDNCAALRKKINNGRPKNEYPKIEKSKKWTQLENKRVLKALQILPEKMQTMVSNLYRMDSSIFGENPAREGQDGIVLYDSSFGDKYSLDRVLAHEISHTLFRKLSDVERSSYLEAAQWRKDAASSNLRVGRSNEAFVNAHGRESSGEDFAVNLEYYLFDPEQLKKVTPKVYEWIKEKYGDWLQLKKLEGEVEQCGIFANYFRYYC